MTLAAREKFDAELKSLPQSTVEVPDVDKPLLPLEIRNQKQFEKDQEKRQRERFFERFDTQMRI